MGDHPSRRELVDFLCGTLSGERARSVAVHLFAGCARCLEEVTRLSGPLPGRDGGGATSRIGGASYAGALSGARDRLAGIVQREEREAKDAKPLVDALLQSPEEMTDDLLSAGRRFLSWSMCRELLQRAETLRHEDPRALVHAASLCVKIAARLDPGRYGRAPLADLKARAWAELANAHRIQDDLRAADEAIRNAWEDLDQGTGDSLVRAEIASLAASIRCHERDFPAAFRLLDLAYALYLEHDHSHEAGRVLILKGLYVAYANDLEEATALTAAGLEMIDRARDPRLTLLALHNLVRCMVESGDYRFARFQLWKMRPLYDRYAGEALRLKLRWLEGAIAIGLGELERAERALAQTREAFTESGMSYHAALVGLDLAGVWLRQRRGPEARALVAELIATFNAIGVDREAMAAVLMLQEAFEQERETLELLQLVATYLKGFEQRLGRVPDSRRD